MRDASPPRTQYSCTRGFFVLSAQSGAVHPLPRACSSCFHMIESNCKSGPAHKCSGPGLMECYIKIYILFINSLQKSAAKQTSLCVSKFNGVGHINPRLSVIYFHGVQVRSLCCARVYSRASTSANSGTLDIPPALVADRPADTEAKRTTASSSSLSSSSGAFPLQSSSYMAEPPKISPAPVLSRICTPFRLSACPEQRAFLYQQPSPPQVT